MARMSENALNPLLAVELGAMIPGWGVTAESTRMLTDSGSAPDIIVETEVAPISVETEYAPARTVEDDALSRVGKTVAATGHSIESAVAVRLPERLSSIPAVRMAEELRAADDYQWCVWIEGPCSVRFPSSGWIEGPLTELATFIEAVAVSERRIAALADAFEEGISQAAGSLRSHFKHADGRATLDKIAAALHLHDSEQVSVMAVAIVANALVFQSAVSVSLGTPTIEELRRPGGAIAVTDILTTWRRILDINYWPIFAVASNVLKPVGESAGQPLLDRLSRVVSDMSQSGVLTTGDLAGQMFGRLIADRKFLATFYTLPASATLLAELAVSRLDGRIDWSDAAAVGRMKAADFACGTGMLLSAAYRCILSRVRRTGRIRELDQARLMHSAFMEHILVGCDIMPAAVHLTASILSAAHPSAPFGNTNIHLMPYGYPEGNKAMPASVGSLELLSDERVRSLFGTGRVRASGDGDHADDSPADASFAVDDNSIDLVIQNPPFTRPNGPEAAKLGVPIPSFAGFGTGDEEQKAMASRLRQLHKDRRQRAGHGNAGLASNFIDLAHAKVKPGGVIALVLPATFVSGDAWAASRELLAREYRDITVVTLASSGADERAFSADTGMAEALVIATRRCDSGGDSSRGSGDSSRGSGDSSRGSGDSSRGSGDSSRGSGDSSRGSGDSSRGSGDSSRGSGDSSRGSGDSSRGSGDSSRGSGDSSRGSGDSSRGSGDSSRGSGDSSRGSGDSSRGSGGIGGHDGAFIVEADWVSLRRRPENPVEAVAMARAVVGSSQDTASGATGAAPSAFLTIGGVDGQQIGCRVAAPLSEGGCAHITEPLVAAAASGLRTGTLRLPRIGAVAVPTVRLDVLGRAGPHNSAFDDRRVRSAPDGGPKLDDRGRVVRNGVFDISRRAADPQACEYPALWGHDVSSGREQRLVVEPDRDLRPWPGHEERARALWPTATHLHYNRDFRLNSQPLAACVTPQRCLGGRAWPSFILEHPEHEQVSALWANTTIGLIGHWWAGTRQQAGRVLLSIRTLPDLVTLDCRMLTDQQISLLGETFEDFAQRPLLPANEAWRDQTRRELDEAVLCDILRLHTAADTARTELLESLTVLRRQWCSEPSVHGGKPTAPPR